MKSESTTDTKLANKRRNERADAAHKLLMWFLQPCTFIITLLCIIIVIFGFLYVANYDAELSAMMIAKNTVINIINLISPYFKTIISVLATNGVQFLYNKNKNNNDINTS